jgi:hypothetical protein
MVFRENGKGRFMVKIIEVRWTNIPWAVEVSGRSMDYILDALNEAARCGYVCTVECLE